MADLQVDSIASTGSNLETLTNEVVKRSGPVIAQGVATFTNSNNNINLTGLGIYPEVGDVLLISGSVSNDGAFTAEFITDNDNVIVNAAHAGGTTSKSLVDETAAVTVTLLCKWFHAAPGLGQGLVPVTRLNNTPYQNLTNRSIETIIIVRELVPTGDTHWELYFGTVMVGSVQMRTGSANTEASTPSVTIQPGTTYKHLDVANVDRTVFEVR